MEEQFFKMDESAALEFKLLSSPRYCEALVMVLMPGKAGGAAPDGGTTGSGHSPATALCWTSCASAQFQEGTCSILTPVVHVPVMSQSHGQATTGNGHVCEIPPAQPEGSWHSFWDQIRGLRIAGGKKKRKKENANPQEWGRTAHAEGDEETARSGAHGFGEEVRVQSIVPSPQDRCPSEERLQPHRVAPQLVSHTCSSHLVWHQYFGSRSNKFFPENLSHAFIQSCQNNL